MRMGSTTRTVWQCRLLIFYRPQAGSLKACPRYACSIHPLKYMLKTPEKSMYRLALEDLWSINP